MQELSLRAVLHVRAGQEGGKEGICLPFTSPHCQPERKDSGFKSPERKGVKIKSLVKKGFSSDGEVLPSLIALTWQ